ncbi:lipopolysaccharide transport periplasmic protein LptA [Ideonella sp. DXS29W]|uniref:Lipopolysaccharide export system protein LptA n=1 Tax=Ideonella lacteola TaxID=2984193 RepID=A0ABU9BNE9_9BURK
MTPPRNPWPHALAVAVCMAAAWGTPAHAEKADRGKPLEVESDGSQPATVDLKTKITTISGHVVVSQGTLQIKAGRIEVRESAPGRYVANAAGTPGQQASFRQKRDRLDEIVEAEADRVEYDGAAEKVRFVGNAKLRVVRPQGPPDEANAAVISYDQRSDTIVFEGGATSAQGEGTGKVRMVFTPRNADPAASEPGK